MAQTNSVPTETTRTDVQIGLVLEDQRNGELRKVIYADSQTVLLRDETGNTTLTPRDPFELEYGTRYQARNGIEPDIEEGQYDALRDCLAQYESQDGRKAKHKADALREALDLLAGPTSAGVDVDTADTADDDGGDEEVPFEDISGVGPETARKLRIQGFVTPDDVRAAPDEAVLAVSGVGPGTLENIREYID